MTIYDSNTQKFDSDVSPCVARRKCLHPYPIKQNKAHTGGLSRFVRENKGYGNERIVFHSLYLFYTHHSLINILPEF